MSESTHWCFKATAKLQSEKMKYEQVSATLMLGHYLAEINQ